MSTARRFTALALAMIVVAFVATWVTVPADAFDDHVSPPASLFLAGLGTRSTCERYSLTISRTCLERADHTIVDLSTTDLKALKQRIVVVYASAAAVVLLVGVAFGAARQRPQEGA